MRGGAAPWAALAIVAVGLSGCAGGFDPVDVAAPAWNAGYAWSEFVETETQTRFTSDGQSTYVNESSVARRITEVLNTTQDASGARAVVVARLWDHEKGPDQISIDVIRARDLSPVPSTYTGHGRSCVAGTCTVQPGELTIFPVEGPPFLPFPLASGQRWEGVVDPSEEPDGSHQVFEAVVDGAANVETPLGTIHAARITIISGPAHPPTVEAKVRADGKAAGYSIDHIEVYQRTERVVYYSPEYEAVVLSLETRIDSRSAQGTQADGSPYDIEIHERSVERRAIDGARLIARPERSLDAAADILLGEIPIQDPTGQAVDGAYKLTIAGGRSGLNAAESPSVRYDAVIKGRASLPDSDTLHWRVVDIDGRPIAEGEGIRFETNITRPGLFTVEVEARRGDDIIASAGTPLRADWMQRVILDCGTTVAAADTMCPIVPSPIHRGARSVAVVAAPDEVNAQLGGILQLDDPNGGRVNGHRSGDVYRADIADFTGLALTQVPWKLQFRPFAGVDATVTVDLHIDYGAGAIVDPVAA